MQDGPTSGALCLASLEPRQDGTSAQVKGSNEGKKGGTSLATGSEPEVKWLRRITEQEELRPAAYLEGSPPALPDFTWSNLVKTNAVTRQRNALSSFC